MPEFISVTFSNASTEINPIPNASIDPEYLVRYARNLDDYGYNYTLVPYDSSSYDPFTIGATILSVTKNIKVIIALRPNTLYPTVAAKALATLDQLSSGRVVVHFIAGGSDAEQAKEGDFLSKDERYARLEDYIKILRRAWKSDESFDWDSKYYQFKQFSNRVRPTNGTIPVSVGGSSDEAYRIGGSLADIFGLWGEPLKETKDQIDRIYAEAAKAGRLDSDRPRIWVTFRPIIAETEDLAWAKAHKTLDALTTNRAKGQGKVPADAPPPQNAGSQRLLDIAARGEVQDRALWYPTVTATNARGASTALVGSPKTVVESLLDYIDLGADLISIRGYDNLNDAIDYGRNIYSFVSFHHVLSCPFLPAVMYAKTRPEPMPAPSAPPAAPIDWLSKIRSTTDPNLATMTEKTIRSQSPIDTDWQELEPSPATSGLGDLAGDKDSSNPTHRGYQSGISELERGVADYKSFTRLFDLDPDHLYNTIISAQAEYKKLLRLEGHRTHAVTERLRAAEVEHSDELMRMEHSELEKYNELKERHDRAIEEAKDCAYALGRLRVDEPTPARPEVLTSNETPNRTQFYQSDSAAERVEGDIEPRISKSTYLPDPERLDDGVNPSFESWLVDMRGKLMLNADHYPTERHKITYVASRTTGKAHMYLNASLSQDAVLPYTGAEDMFEDL
ncbi:hypothetical protein N7505_003946 [Penicillium chrysogenum]|uniref:Luciferase-like domain-containing protein n=1 Tax=Penicillium chrysogenum TaxID=5076 RepID=A0ABQ8WSE1_PENCH|nr:hypothetical protein N7505_003946 [Penicillium chrysogenum]